LDWRGEEREGSWIGEERGEERVSGSERDREREKREETRGEGSWVFWYVQCGV